MAQEFVSVRMSDLTSLEAYDLLASTVVPRPIAFVSTMSADGIANLAPFSFFMTGGANPPSLMYSPTLNKQGLPKDSLANVIETGEFVVNSVHREMAEGMNATSFDYPRGSHEWEVSGFTPLPSELVKPPRVAESLIQFECRLFKVVEHGKGPNAARYVIGEVLLIHLDKSLAENPSSTRLISRMGGPNYVDTVSGEVFQMRRPPNPV